MDSRVAKKRTFRGSSSNVQSDNPITALSLLSDDIAGTFADTFGKRNIVRQSTLYLKTLGHLHLPEIFELLRFQNFHLFLECDTPFNEDLVKISMLACKESLRVLNLNIE